jgi:hypothetical protein
VIKLYLNVKYLKEFLEDLSEDKEIFVDYKNNIYKILYIDNDNDKIIIKI